MIRLIFGNVGSGKTASIVRYMKHNPHKKFITNIDVKGKDFKHVMKLKADMIINKVHIKTKKNGEDVFKKTLNKKFWQELITEHKNVSIIIDELHTFLNPRRSMSDINLIMTDFLALIRRVLGSSDGNGEFIGITQLSRRLDIILREMATDIQFCIHHYINKCKKCGLEWGETNETSRKYYNCPKCNGYIINKIKSEIEVYKFKNIQAFMEFNNFHTKTYYDRYFITDIHTIFGNYNTLQFDDLLAQY